MYPQENVLVRLDDLKVPSGPKSLGESNHERLEVLDRHQGPDLEIHSGRGECFRVIEEVVI